LTDYKYSNIHVYNIKVNFIHIQQLYRELNWLKTPLLDGLYCDGNYIIISVSFMQGIYTSVPETNYVPRDYSIAAILLFLFMVHTSLAPVLNLLHFYISTFQSMCAVPNMAVFCSPLISWIPGTLLRYFLNDFQMVPVDPIYYWYHICFYVLHALYFYCKVFIFQNILGSFLITFLSPGIATSINIHVLFSLSLIMMSRLLLGMVLLHLLIPQ
jgi:hypothetical protein